MILMKKRQTKFKNKKLRLNKLNQIIVIKEIREEMIKVKVNKERRRSSQERMRSSRISRNKIAMMSTLKFSRSMRELPMLISRKHSQKSRLDSSKKSENSIT